MIVIDGVYKFEILEMCAMVKPRFEGGEALYFASLTYEFKDLEGVWTAKVWSATSGHSMAVRTNSEDDAYAWFEHETTQEVMK